MLCASNNFAPSYFGRLMEPKPRTTRGTRLGTQFRGKLAAAYGQRGVAPNSLWYVYSPRTQTDWVLRSDLEWDHFVLTESDPNIATCNYLPERHSLAFEGEQMDVPVDAIVTYRDGSIEWREIRFAGKETDEATPTALQLSQRIAAGRHVGIAYRLWTEDTIRRNHMLLANWRRVIAWMTAARDRSLSGYQEELARAFKSEGVLTLGQIEAMFGEASFGLYAAAAFRELQQGMYSSDLDEMPLSLHTVIQMQ